MSKDSVLRLKSSIVYKTLLIKQVQDGFDNKLTTKLEIVVDNISDLLERIPENMPEYTLHDPNHSAKIVDIIGKFLPDTTLQHLNSIELTLMILAAYLHDVGMTASKEEKESIINLNVDFKILFKTFFDKKERFDYYLSINDHRSATFIEDQIFTEFLRRHHVSRTAEYIKTNLVDGAMAIEIDGIPFWKHLITICNGHGEPVSKIRNIEIFPINTLVGEKIINVQFLTLLLRLGDILDLDPERTPKIIYEYVNPQDPISLIEWKKHRSIIGYSINSEKILFEAECAVPEVERALKEFMHWIELERKQTMQLLHEHTLPSLLNYKLLLNEEVTIDRIRSNGTYIYNDFKFQIDYQKVLDLLMGQRLYRNTVFSLRELLQNSTDAIKARQEIFTKKDEKFEPQISIILDSQNLIIKDNGIGMDINVFENYFLQIGKSYYSSPAFYSQYSEIDVTSEFGIGVLSVFMIANSLSIESRREPDNPISPPKPIYFEIPTAYSYTVQKESYKTDVGTIINLQLKSQNPFKNFKIKSILPKILPNPIYPIKVIDKGNEFLYKGIDEINIPTVPDFDTFIKAEDFMFDDLAFEETKKRFTHTFFEIDFTKSDNEILKNITGKLFLVNSGKYNWYSLLNGSFCQRNFAIGNVVDESDFDIEVSDNIKRLFPVWLSYYSTLNLTKSACLSITPDRTDIIIDDKYEVLKKLIEEYIIFSLKNAFEAIRKSSVDTFNSYIDFIIATGFININVSRKNYQLSETARFFLSTYITFPTCQNGRTIRLSAMEIEKLEIIGVTYEHTSDENKTLMGSLFPNVALIIPRDMEHGAGWEHRIESFIYSLCTDKNELNRPYCVLSAMLPHFKIDIVKYQNKFGSVNDYSCEQNILEEFDGHKILFLPKNSYSLQVTLNASHPLINTVFKPDWTLRINGKKTLQLFQDLISNALERSIKKINTNNEVFFNMAFNQFSSKNNQYLLTKGIIKSDPEFINYLNEGIVDIWKSMIKLELVGSTDLPVKITSADLPTYWSA